MEGTQIKKSLPPWMILDPIIMNSPSAKAIKDGCSDMWEFDTTSLMEYQNIGSYSRVAK
jgi:hypothetical protein